MKRILRSVVFSALSLYLTSLVIGGFVVKTDLKSYALATLILAAIYYFVLPLTKLVLLPLNILTLGLVSTIAYIIIFNYVISYFGFIAIVPWGFPGAHIYGFVIPKFYFNYLATLIISAILYSSIINLAETIV